MGLELVCPTLPSQRFPLGSPGGADKNVIVFDKSSEQILATLKGHTKKVTSVVFHPSQVRLALPSLPGRLRSGYQDLPLVESPTRSSGGGEFSLCEPSWCCPHVGFGVLGLS